MEQIIQLEADDDITSIRSRLEWTDAKRVLLLVPARNKVLRNLVNLKILARVADSRNIQVALVSQNLQLRDAAKQAKLKVYATEWLAQRAGFVSPAAEKAGPEKTLPPQLQLLEAPAPARQRVKQKRPQLVLGSGRVGLGQQLVAFILVALLALVLVIIFLAIAPVATITLTPQLDYVQNELTLTADPAAEAIDRENKIVPALAVQVERTITASVETIDVEAAPVGRARGVVVFFNRTQSEQRIPVSTTLTTSSGVPIEFRTTVSATIPAGTGATVQVPVVAVEPGPSGNVPAGQINRFDNPTLGLLARVINDSGTGGGTVELAGVVTEEDKLRLRAKMRQVVQQIGYEALLENAEPGTFIPPESLQVIELSVSYDQFSGDVSPFLSGEMRAVVRATAIDSFQVNQLAYFELLAQVPENQELLAEGLSFEAGGVQEINDRAVTFPVQGEGVVVYQIDRDEIREAITGLSIGEAQAWLSGTQPIVSVPGVDVQPNWLGRLPVLPFRINVEVRDVTQSAQLMEPETARELDSERP